LDADIHLFLILQLPSATLVQFPGWQRVKKTIVGNPAGVWYASVLSQRNCCSFGDGGPRGTATMERISGEAPEVEQPQEKPAPLLPVRDKKPSAKGWQRHPAGHLEKV